jgi:hypothetical protein
VNSYAALEQTIVLARTKVNITALGQMKSRTLHGCTFIVGASEGFETAFRGGDFWGYFRHGTGAAASPSEADEPEPNKSNACTRARPEPPPHAEVGDILPLLILIFAEEVFSMMLSLKDCELNFQLGFRGLANTTS